MFLPDGYSTLVGFHGAGFDMTFFIQERQVQPPSIALGGGIDTTTMRNKWVRTTAPKSLATIGELTIQAYYDPSAFATMLQSVVDAFAGGNPPPGVAAGTRLVIGRPGILTLTWPDAATWAYPAFLDSMTPPMHKEGELPELEVKFLSSMRNPDTGQEVRPTYANGRNVGQIAR